MGPRRCRKHPYFLACERSALGSASLLEMVHRASTALPHDRHVGVWQPPLGRQNACWVARQGSLRRKIVRITVKTQANHFWIHARPCAKIVPWVCYDRPQKGSFWPLEKRDKGRVASVWRSNIVRLRNETPGHNGIDETRPDWAWNLAGNNDQPINVVQRSEECCRFCTTHYFCWVATVV